MDPLINEKATKREPETRRSQALGRMGLAFDPPSVKLEETLRRAFPGGFREVIEQYVTPIAKGNPAYERLLAVYNTVSISDREQHLRAEDFLAAAGLGIGEFLGQLTTAAYNQNAAVAAMIAAVNQPKVIQATVEAAIDPKNGSVKDRENFLKITKMLPAGGSGVTLNFGAVPGAAEGPKEVVAGDEGFMRFENEVRDNATDLRIGEGRKMLEGATEYKEGDIEAEIVNAEFEDEV